VNESRNWGKIIGVILHVLIGGMMILAGSFKILGLIPPEAREQLGPLAEQITLIGIGEVVTAILLLIPRTLSLGILLASSFWGGAICLHMSKGESYAVVATLLVLSWIGAYLRNPALFGSFAASPRVARKVVDESAFVTP
jgi:hypothetical protein